MDKWLNYISKLFKFTFWTGLFSIMFTILSKFTSLKVILGLKNYFIEISNGIFKFVVSVVGIVSIEITILQIDKGFDVFNISCNVSDSEEEKVLPYPTLLFLRLLLFPIRYFAGETICAQMDGIIEQMNDTLKKDDLSDKDISNYKGIIEGCQIAKSIYQ